MEKNKIEIQGIKKRFNENIVLQDVSIKIKGGEVLALMGANGAGKSTLVKILSGVYRSDGGSILINGKKCNIDSPAEAIEAGVITVHQTINDGVVQDLTVAENLVLDRLCKNNKNIFIQKKSLYTEARKIASLVGLDLPLDLSVSELSQADKQLVGIARALAKKPSLLILDEPTSSLSDSETTKLFDAINKMRSDGVAIIYISHRMSDIRALADRIATLREGRIVGNFTKPLDYAGAVDSMLGHKVADIKHTYNQGNETILELKNYKLKKNSNAFDLIFKRGEIVVLTGLLSSGCHMVIESLFGLDKPYSGEVFLDGKKWVSDTPKKAIERGIFMLQEDRGNNAIIPDFSIEENVTFPFLKYLSNKFGFIKKESERLVANKILNKTGVKYRDSKDLLSTLSGGNQQKVMVSRWMLNESKVFLLNEPFQGVDIGSRREIGKLLRSTANLRATVVVCTDIEEALEIADRIIVFNNNNLVGEHNINQIDMKLIINQIASAKFSNN
ncbi:sugar ABC transporter ATP-binding protein [Testudinibacter sp. P27/CKL/0425]